MVVAANAALRAERHTGQLLRRLRMTATPQPPSRPAGSRLVFAVPQVNSSSLIATGAGQSPSHTTARWRTEHQPSPSRDVRPRLDENAPCPSAQTPMHLQANCGARNLQARFDQRERVSSKGSLRPCARTQSERRRQHASEPHRAVSCGLNPTHLSADRGARNLSAASTSGSG